MDNGGEVGLLAGPTPVDNGGEVELAASAQGNDSDEGELDVEVLEAPLGWGRAAAGDGGGEVGPAAVGGGLSHGGRVDE